MPNPSVLAGYADEVDYWKMQLAHGIHSKATKKYLLAQLREAAKLAGITVPAYNTSEFTEWVKKGA